MYGGPPSPPNKKGLSKPKCSYTEQTHEQRYVPITKRGSKKEAVSISKSTKVFWDAALNEAEGLLEGRIKRGQEAAYTTAPLFELIRLTGGESCRSV